NITAGERLTVREVLDFYTLAQAVVDVAPVSSASFPRGVFGHLPGLHIPGVHALLLVLPCSAPAF
ncbi:MAG: hypothetical protein ACE5HI_15205, partial [bacterium]